MEYTASIRSSMVRKMTGPRAKSATALARETGIPQPTLSRWLREAGSVRDVSRREPGNKPGRRPQDWPLEEILEAVLEASRLSGEELGAFLRRKARSAEARRVRELEKELRRKEKALAEAAALLVLQKKLRDLLGGGDASTPPRSDG